jgi:hypothetical protein
MPQDREILADSTQWTYILNGPIVATAISREKRKPVLKWNGYLTDWELLVCPAIWAM